MRTQVFYGYKCLRCNSTIDVDIVIGAFSKNKPVCPSCGTDMEPNLKGRIVATNVSCRNCGSVFGMVNSDVCPICGTPFS